MKHRILVSAIFALLSAAFVAKASTIATLDERVERLLSQMTLEEKIGQLIQVTASDPNLGDLAAAGKLGSAFNFGEDQPTNDLQKRAVEESRLGIPLIFGHDVIHGYRTIFPIPLAIASTFDPAMAESAARVSAREARAAAIHWTFAPMVDIARDPRWGRIAEGSGEDPVLTAAMARGWVRGFQGEDLTSKVSVLACAKHFAAYGASEGGRDYNSTDMSESRLREVYLPPFQAAVDEGVGSLMTGFNALNGVPATANRHLLDRILRDEWGFRGLVVSDYQAVEQLIPHGVAANPEEAAILSITAGVDMNMVDAAYLKLESAVREGRLSQDVVDQAVRRVLRVKFALGLFDHPYTERPAPIVPTAESRAAALEVARRSIVLLKNEGSILPLSKDESTIAIVGPFADSGLDMLGSWYAAGKPEDVVTPLEAIRKRVQPPARILFAKGGSALETTDAEIEEAISVARDADIILAFLGEPGRMSGEAKSRVSLDLTGRQDELLRKLVATGKPVVLLLNSGRPLSITWAAENVRAILNTWFLGIEAGNAIADVLFGDFNPAGRLPVSFPRSVGQIPVYYSHLRTGRPPDPDKQYTSKYLDSPNDPLFPFGFGLSYSNFVYRDIRLSDQELSRGRVLRASVEVKNEGTRAGEEVIQLYISDPVASVARPVRELKAFRRVRLEPGESRRVEFELMEESLRFWGETGWVVEPGTFRVTIGPSSATGLEQSFKLAR